MLKSHNQILITLTFLVDIALAHACWLLAYYLRFYWLNLPVADHVPSLYHYLKAAPVIVLLAAVTFIASGVYRYYSVSRLAHQIQYLIKSTAWLFVVITAAAFFYRKFSYSRVQVVYFSGLYLTALILARLLIDKILLNLHKRGIHTQNLLIVGDSKMIHRFVSGLRRYHTAGLHLCGIVAVEGNPKAGEIEGVPVYTDLNQLPQLLAQLDVNQVFIALSAERKAYLSTLHTLLRDQMLDIKIIPDLGAFRQINTDVENFEGVPIITITQSPLVGWNRVLKRVMDILGSMLALLLFSPVMLAITTLIKLGSKGPVLYKQERMGFDGNTFMTYKFRSMRTDAESQTGAVWAKAGDDRVTPVGRFIRKTSLDELPQLFNVLQGNMSLVGPRPERPVFIEDFKHQIPNYMLRHKVKAGMTGWAQINGWRGNTSLEKRIEFDLYYIENWSLWLDIKILFLTIFKGFVDPNAY